MAEGLIGGILGEDDDKPEAEAADAPAGTAAAAATAVAVKLADTDPEVARRTAEFLVEQAELLRVQRSHLQDEHLLRVAHLENQHAEENIRRFGLRLRVGFQLFMVLIATVIGIGLLLMIRGAMTADGVVVDAFQVPPELAQRGLTGQVVARQLLDRLAEVQIVTSQRSARPASSYAGSWGSDLKLEVPETGVTFGELNRYLHEALGHETHISGEIVLSGADATVTARVGEEAGRSYTGPAGTISQLVQRAAESTYEQTEPYRFANYLYGSGRWDEAQPVMRRLTQHANPVERGWAAVLAASAAAQLDHDFAAMARLGRTTMVEIPGFPRGFEYVADAESYLGHDALSVEFAAKCLDGNTADQATIAVDWRDFVTAHCQFRKAVAEGDYVEAIRAASTEAAANHQTSALAVGWIVQAQLLSHDLDGALGFDWAAALDAVAKYPSLVALLNAKRDHAAAFVALERNEARAVDLWTAAAAGEDFPATTASHDYMLRNSGAWMAYARARFGDLKGGQALIAQTPLDCRRCVQLRGRIAALAGDTAAAENWFQQAIDVAPKLPQAWVDRGQARLDRSALADALADATQAATLSPHDGDAWKLWGDVLARQGQGKAALAKYDEALKYAPKWAALVAARVAASRLPG